MNLDSWGFFPSTSTGSEHHTSSSSSSCMSSAFKLWKVLFWTRLAWPIRISSRFFAFLPVLHFFLRGGFEDLPTFCQISLRVEEKEETHSSKISWYKTGRRNFLQRNCLKTELGGWIFVWGFMIKNPPHDQPLILIPPSPHSLFKLLQQFPVQVLNGNSFFFAILSVSVWNCMAFSLV